MTQAQQPSLCLNLCPARGGGLCFPIPPPQLAPGCLPLQALDEHPLCAELCPGYRSRKDGLSKQVDSTDQWDLSQDQACAPSGSLPPWPGSSLGTWAEIPPASGLSPWPPGPPLLMHLSGTSCETVILGPVTQEPSSAPYVPGAPSGPPPHAPGMRFGSRIF